MRLVDGKNGRKRKKWLFLAKTVDFGRNDGKRQKMAKTVVFDVGLVQPWRRGRIFYYLGFVSGGELPG